MYDIAWIDIEKEMAMGGRVNDLGRWTEPALLILVSLAGGEKHGYAMMEDVERMTGIHIGPGTLYTILPRLERQGMIEPLPADERRRPYRLTDAGIEALQAQLADLQGFAVIGLQRLHAL